VQNRSSETHSLGSNEPEQSSLQLRHYLEILRKRAWLIAAVVAVGVTGTVLYTLRQPKVYQASASIIIDPQPPQVFGSSVQEVVQLGTGGYWSNQDYYNTQVEILKSYDLAELTVRRYGLQHNEKLVPKKLGDPRTEDQLVAAASAALTGMLDSSQDRDSRIVRVFVRNTDADLAVDLANKHIDTFLEYTRGLRSEGSSSVGEYLSGELDRAEKSLRENEEALSKFKQDNDILSVSLEDKQSMLAADLERYTTAHSEAKIKRLELEAVRERISKLSDEDVSASPIFGLTGNEATVEPIKSQLATARQKLAELREELGPKHPVYLSQLEKTAELEKILKTEAHRAEREIDEQYQATLAKERRYAAEIERLKQDAFELGPKAIEYKRYRRKYKHAEDNYNLVLSRLQTNDISSRNREINIRPHTSARTAKLVAPRMRLNVVLAVLLSLIVGVGLAFGLEQLDQTVRAGDALEIAVKAPLLGVIPIVEEVGPRADMALSQDRDLFVYRNPKSRAAECCRSIRTNILFSTADKPHKKLVVSSPRPKDGKTTAAVYLATTMAQSGQRVLLVDTDLRRPRLHKSLGVARTPGLTNMILGESSAEDAIKNTEVPNLFVLPAGPNPPNPAELLLTSRFQAVLAELEQKFDRIIFDSPPLLAVTDAVVLTRAADGVVLVLRAGQTTMDDAMHAARQLRDVDGEILGVVLNDADMGDRRYGYYQYYAHTYAEAGDATQST